MRYAASAILLSVLVCPLSRAGTIGPPEAGIDASLWGWFAYYGSNQSDYRNTWSGEVEVDLTKTFAKRISIAADIEILNYDDRMRGNFEQLFTSILLSPDSGTLITIGKFNSPFGAEGHDFWDRYTATPSLLFRAQPQDLRGVMLTAPIGTTNITLRPFIVSGFHDEDDVHRYPSAGIMAEYRPNDRLDMAVTGWVGPGVRLAGYDEDYEYDEEYVEQYENWKLLDSWTQAGFRPAHKGQLYFANAHATYKPRRDLTLVGELIFGATNVDSYMSHWFGLMALVNFDIDDHLRTFAQWSYLDDTDWVVGPEIQRRHEVEVGLGYRVNQNIELRAGYRHDFSDVLDDVDTISMHASIGY